MPEVTRMENGQVKKHWTIDEVEQLERERRAAFDAKIRANLNARRSGFLVAMALFGASIFSRLKLRPRHVHPETI